MTTKHKLRRIQHSPPKHRPSAQSFIAESVAKAPDMNLAEAPPPPTHTTETCLNETIEKQYSSENVLKDCKLLYYVEKSSIDSSKITQRLPELETLSSYVFQNADGTNTVFMLSENVKFVNENGKIIEKDLTLKSNGSFYTTTANDIKLMLPATIDAGVTITYKDSSIKFITNETGIETEIRENAALYNINEYCQYKYTPLLSGVKEDIILSKYYGQNEFFFIIQTENVIFSDNCFKSEDNDFHGGNTQRWIFEQHNDGYYTIKSANDTSTNYYLGVQGDSTSNNTSIVLRTGAVTNGMLWKIEATGNGNYKLTPKTGESAGRVLAVATIGGNIQQKDYVDDGNPKDELMICKFNKGMLIAKEEEVDNQKSFYFVNAKTLLQKRRGKKLTIVSTSDFYNASESAVLNNILTNNIFIECSHGNKQFFRISGNKDDPPFDGDGIYAGVLAYNDLSGLEFVYFMSCNSGQDYNSSSTRANNLVRGAEMAGAKCVIGFSDVIDRNDANSFLNYILQKCILERQSVSQAFQNFTICNYRDCYNNEYLCNNFKDLIVIAYAESDYNF